MVPLKSSKNRNVGLQFTSIRLLKIRKRPETRSSIPNKMDSEFMSIALLLEKKKLSYCPKKLVIAK